MSAGGVTLPCHQNAVCKPFVELGGHEPQLDERPDAQVQERVVLLVHVTEVVPTMGAAGDLLRAVHAHVVG